MLVVCSSCAEEEEVLVEDLDDVDREVCACGHSYIVLSVSAFEPVQAEQAQLLQLPPARRLPKAA